MVSPVLKTCLSAGFVERGRFSGSNPVHSLQCDQLGDQVCHAQLPNASEGTRDGGHGVQNTG